jgi:hypothetical protein
MRVARPAEALPLPASPGSVESEPRNIGDTDGNAAERGTIQAAAQPFAQLLRRLGKELDRGEDLAERAIRGGSHTSSSPEQLIALQAGIYRYSEAVDLVTKLVDRGTQAVRTTLQNQ